MRDAVAPSPPPRSALPAPGRRRTGKRPLVQAVASAVVLLGLVAIASALGRRAFFVLICAVSLTALAELLDALWKVGRRPVVAVGVAGALGLLVGAYAGRPAWMGAALGVTTFGSLVLTLRPRRGPSPVGDAAWTVLAVAWIGGGAAAAVALMNLDPGGLQLVIAYVLVVACDDVAAYFVGSRWGRRKLAPSISPGKSWEGAAAGAVGALAAGAVAGGVLDGLGWLEGVGLGALCALAAPVGDLVESLVKRELGVKDSGGLLPGHGGFLDRIDAIVFCAPVVLVYARVLAG